ncbi:extracellular solute-binding protein [Arhodomonas sp. SL1]|uniref:extracellular solute-binding protein n=1 Tax=Arhodomonas sp. SL1 TaxID=3425691 RepID=UPI003F8828B8
MSEQSKIESLSRRRFLKGTGSVLGAAGVASMAPFSLARGRDELTMLAWNGHAEPDIVGEFEREHGVRIRAKYYTGGDNMMALIAQSPPGTYDLILSDSEYVQQLRAAGHIQSLDPGDYNFDDYFPEFQEFPFHWENGELYSVLARFGFLGVSYRTDHISEEQARTYRLFWDEQLKGKMAHFDWHLPNLGQMSLLNGNESAYDLTEEQWRAVQETTLSLRSQVAGFFGYGGTFSSLKTGEVQAMCGIGDWITGVLEREGTPVRTVIPEEGGLMWSEAFCIGKGARNPELAKKFIQYITSPKGQAKSAQMQAYPAMIPSRKGWERLNEVAPQEAKRQGMVFGERNSMDLIREGLIQYRQLPVQQSLEDWNGFWSEYKNA